MTKKSIVVLSQDLLSFQKEKDHTKDTRFKKNYRNGLLVLILVLICLQFFFSAAQILNKSVNKRLTRWGGRALIGVVQKIYTSRPVFSYKTFSSGKWQKQFELWFTNAVPFRARIVRGHNQFYFQVFKKAYPPNIIIGKQGYLFGSPYIEKYYNTLKKDYDPKSFEVWADDLQALAQFFAQRGQQFIYFITPSKSTYFSEYLPECHRCNKNKVRPDYHLATHTLKKRGFGFVDTSEMVLRLKKDFRFYLFPKGGVHWTDLAAAYAAQSLVKHIQTQNPIISNFTFSYRLVPVKQSKCMYDADFLYLANLSAPPLGYEVPNVIITKPQKGKEKLKVAFIGGSFTNQPGKILAQTQLFKQIDIYNYLIVRHQQYVKDGELPEQIMLKSDKHVYYPEDYKDLWNADVVILEENEQNLRSKHFKLLLKRTIGREAEY